MIIYLQDPQKTEAATLLVKSGVQLWQKPQDAGPMDTWDQININPLERVDGLLLEITKADAQINYLLAQAILLQKETLCFFEKSNPPRPLLMYLRRKNVPRSIQIKSYCKNNLKDTLYKFVKSIKPTLQIAEVPNIKYTLRMTESLENYLNWKSQHGKINKADFIRDNLKKIMEEDQDYFKWRNK
ncbi:MAG: hypothetical protein WC752_03505 [Patescibacteria group bacterium]|jgi:hypothetical protein